MAVPAPGGTVPGPRWPSVSRLFVVDVTTSRQLCRVPCGTSSHIGGDVLPSSGVPRAGSGGAAGPAACGLGLGRPRRPHGDRRCAPASAPPPATPRFLLRPSRGPWAPRVSRRSPGGAVPPAAHETALGVTSCSQLFRAPVTREQSCGRGGGVLPTLIVVIVSQYAQRPNRRFVFLRCVQRGMSAVSQ